MLQSNLGILVRLVLFTSIPKKLVLYIAKSFFNKIMSILSNLKLKNLVQNLFFHIIIDMTNNRRRVIENYTIQDMLGEGVFGKVFRATNKITPGEFAIKVIPVQLFKQNKKLQECTVNEINTLSTIKPSPHIVKYVQMLKTSNNFYFVYELCNGGTLESVLKNQKKLLQGHAIGIFKQLIQAFKILNQHNIMHRDVKPDNIFFHDGIVKLGDFGFCKSLSNDTDMTSTMLGSPIYMAPEILKGENYTSKADVWSLGVVLFQMLFGYCPFESNSIANLISTIKDSNLKMPLEINNISENCQYLIRRMLTKDPSERISWQELFKLDIGQEVVIQQKDNDLASIQKHTERASNSQIKQKQQVVGYNLAPQQKQLPHRSTFQKKISQPVSTSLHWQNDTGFKNFLANTTNKPTVSKISVDASLPADFGSISNKIENYFTSSKGLQPVSSSIEYRPSTSLNKRKQIIQEHELCTRGIKTAIDIINIDDRNSLSFSYIILIKIETRLKKISQSIQAKQPQLQDIFSAINIQLANVEKSIIEIREELFVLGLDLLSLQDPRAYLGLKFKQCEIDSLRVWHDMINVLFGDRVINPRDKGRQQLLEYIKSKINIIP